MSAHADGNLVLAESMGDLEFTQQRGLLEHIELPGTVAGKQLADGIPGSTGPDVGSQRIYTGTPGGLDPQVAVDEHPARMLAGHHHNG